MGHKQTASDERQAANYGQGARMMSWKSLLARSTAVGAILSVFVAGAAFIGVKLAGADPGGPPTRHAFTFAGVLSNSDGGPTTSATMLRFVFRRMGAPDCTPIPVRAEPNSHGAFSVPVPIDGCGTTFFNGTDVSYDVFVVGEDAAVASNVAITPVPYARFADQAGVNNDCPAGYVKSVDPGDTAFSVCRRTLGGGRFDEVVKVGTGGSAFWIDRYEASVWTTSSATGGTQIFQRDEDFNMVQFPRNGQGPGPAFALSVVNVTPANSITWFQANEACASSGKRLPTGSEWLRAARGTVDPSDPESGNSGCRTSNVDPMFMNRPRTTGLGAMNCRSFVGAQDMIGNLWEWTDEWYGGAGNAQAIDFTGVQLVDGGVRPALSAGRVFQGVTVWPDTTGDMTSNFNNYVNRSNGTHVSGLPGAAARGGDFGSGRQAGVLAVYIDEAPSAWRAFTGFRCVVPR